MIPSPLFSIRMRASAGEKHISGAERLVPRERLEQTAAELLSRALHKGCSPGQIVLTVDALQGAPPLALKSLEVIPLGTGDCASGRAAAAAVLRLAGVSSRAAERAIHLLGAGAAPSGQSMRGAMIMDAASGERLEPDQERGIRVSRFDWTDEALEAATRKLAAAGLTHFRTREALALATKVAHGPAVAAELCWSDEPDYCAGYAASLKTGYVRFPELKEPGDPRGGRVFFVERSRFDRNLLTQYLEAAPVLIADTGVCRKVIAPETFFGEHKQVNDACLKKS